MYLDLFLIGLVLIHLSSLELTQGGGDVVSNPTTGRLRVLQALQAHQAHQDTGQTNRIPKWVTQGYVHYIYYNTESI